MDAITHNEEVIAKILKSDGLFPNNEQLPVLIYKNALDLRNDDPASIVEKVFKSNKWGNAWRNGIFDYQHYHSTAHEVLGIYSGIAKLQLGGPKGITVDIMKGDVVIIPAGVAHKNLGSSLDFKCVGAYPRGQEYDMNYGQEGERPETDKNIKATPLPETDPVFGGKGHLIEKWLKQNH